MRTNLIYFKAMSNNKQSSIDWLIIEIMQHQKTFYGTASIPFRLIEKAKAMHKEEIEDAYFNGSADRLNDEGSFEEYYTNTFGGEDA